ncbi:MAG: S26 family signal peptidase, partial [Candidatus Omnitrophota bacterium]
MKTLSKEILIPLLTALVVYLGFQAIISQYVVQQTSMLPSIVDGQRLFVGKISYFFGDPQRGDII